MNTLIIVAVLIACMVWSVVVWCWKAFVVLIVIPVIYIVVFIWYLPLSIITALRKSNHD